MNENGSGARMSDYTRNLAAGVPQSINVIGDYWQLIKTPGGEVKVELDESVTMMRAAPCGGPGNYRRVTITSPVDQTVVMCLGITNGAVPYDNRTVITGTLTVDQTPPVGIFGLPDQDIVSGGSYTFPANANRDTLGITLSDTAPDFVRVTDASSPNGQALFPGGDRNVRTSGAVTVRNPNGVTVRITASETRRS